MTLTYQYNNATVTNDNYEKNKTIYSFETVIEYNPKPKKINPYKFIKDKDSKKFNGRFK